MPTEFKIIESTFLSFREIKLFNKNSGEYITVLPELGARLNEVVLKKGNENIPILKNLESANLESRDNQFNNAKLFPFANRLEGGKYIFEGKEFQLPLNYPEENNACHGFIFDKPFLFESSEMNEEFGEISFSYNYIGEVIGYPFPFNILIKYKLFHSGKIECVTEIINNSKVLMPFSDGWHHYFTLGKSVDNLAMEIEAKSEKILNKLGIPTGEEIQLSENDLMFILKDKILDTIYLLQNNNKVITKLIDPVRKLTLNIWQENSKGKYNFLNMYTPVDRKSIAIEPMTSNINAFNNRDGLLILKPSESWSGVMGLYFE